MKRALTRQWFKSPMRFRIGISEAPLKQTKWSIVNCKPENYHWTQNNQIKQLIIIILPFTPGIGFAIYSIGFDLIFMEKRKEKFSSKMAIKMCGRIKLGKNNFQQNQPM